MSTLQRESRPAPHRHHRLAGLLALCAMLLPLGTAGAATSADATPATTPAATWDLDGAKLLSPFWKDHTVRGESLLFIQEPGAATATASLLLTPAAILRVRSSAGDREYHEGRDFTVNGRTLTLTAGSSIPTLRREALYLPKGAPHALKARVGDPDTWLMYQEAYFPTIQVEVDYRSDEPWTGYHPTVASAALQRTIATLQRHGALRIAVVGDSITAGANASNHRPPFMPAYVGLVAETLRRACGSAVEVANLAVPGTMANGGMDQVPAVLAARPDLLLIAYGMNDTARHQPAAYAGDILKIIAAVRAARPACEFLVVTSSLANPEWTWSPAAQFPAYRAALLAALGPDVAVADMTALYTGMLARKRYHDFTGNGINHPNDHGHRLYAEVVLGLLIP